MTNPEEATCALWYWSHYIPMVSWHGTEEEAVDVAIDMVRNEWGSPVGVQFKDGRLVKRDDWELYNSTCEKNRKTFEEEAEELIRLKKLNPPAKHNLKWPFNPLNTRVVVHGEIPDWLEA